MGALFAEKLKFRDGAREAPVPEGIRGSGRRPEAQAGDRDSGRDPERQGWSRPNGEERLAVDEAPAGSLPRQRQGGKPVGFHGNEIPGGEEAPPLPPQAPENFSPRGALSRARVLVP